MSFLVHEKTIEECERTTKKESCRRMSYKPAHIEFIAYRDTHTKPVTQLCRNASAQGGSEKRENNGHNKIVSEIDETTYEEINN